MARKKKINNKLLLVLGAVLLIICCAVAAIVILVSKKKDKAIKPPGASTDDTDKASVSPSGDKAEDKPVGTIRQPDRTEKPLALLKKEEAQDKLLQSQQEENKNNQPVPEPVNLHDPNVGVLPQNIIPGEEGEDIVDPYSIPLPSDSEDDYKPVEIDITTPPGEGDASVDISDWVNFSQEEKIATLPLIIRSIFNYDFNFNNLNRCIQDLYSHVSKQGSSYDEALEAVLKIFTLFDNLGMELESHLTSSPSNDTVQLISDLKDVAVVKRARITEDHRRNGKPEDFADDDYGLSLGEKLSFVALYYPVIFADFVHDAVADFFRAEPAINFLKQNLDPDFFKVDFDTDSTTAFEHYTNFLNGANSLFKTLVSGVVDVQYMRYKLSESFEDTMNKIYNATKDGKLKASSAEELVVYEFSDYELSDLTVLNSEHSDVGVFKSLMNLRESQNSLFELENCTEVTQKTYESVKEKYRDFKNTAVELLASGVIRFEEVYTSNVIARYTDQWLEKVVSYLKRTGKDSIVLTELLQTSDDTTAFLESISTASRTFGDLKVLDLIGRPEDKVLITVDGQKLDLDGLRKFYSIMEQVCTFNEIICDQSNRIREIENEIAINSELEGSTVAELNSLKTTGTVELAYLFHMIGKGNVKTITAAARYLSKLGNVIENIGNIEDLYLDFVDLKGLCEKEYKEHVGSGELKTEKTQQLSDLYNSTVKVASKSKKVLSLIIIVKKLITEALILTTGHISQGVMDKNEQDLNNILENMGKLQESSHGEILTRNARFDQIVKSINVKLASITNSKTTAALQRSFALLRERYGPNQEDNDDFE